MLGSLEITGKLETGEKKTSVKAPKRFIHKIEKLSCRKKGFCVRYFFSVLELLHVNIFL